MGREVQAITFACTLPPEPKFRAHFWSAFDFKRWRLKNLLEWFATHLVQKTTKCLRLQNPLQPKFRARIWRLRVSPTAGSAGKGVFLRYTDERDAFWLKCESQHAICEETRRNSPRVCGWVGFIVHLSCAPWVLFNSLEPFPHQRTTKKVSSPHVKCNFFCSKTLKKVVSYLTSVLRIFGNRNLNNLDVSG